MTPRGWSYALASVIGTSHTKTGASCQDASACRVFKSAAGASILVAVASDGAGSATHGGEGALLACDLFVAEIEQFLDGGGDVLDLDQQFAEGWLTHFQNEIALRAEATGLTSRDFACTFLAAVVGPEAATFTQIGDGAIVFAQRGEDDYSCPFIPQRGEYENVTYFATEDRAAAQMEHLPVEWRVDEVALFTDGIQRLALNMQQMTPHAPFFRPMFTPMRAAQDGYSEELSQSLAAFLASPSINERTDDDKTLILATRRASEPLTVKLGLDDATV